MNTVFSGPWLNNNDIKHFLHCGTLYWGWASISVVKHLLGVREVMGSGPITQKQKKQCIKLPFDLLFYTSYFSRMTFPIFSYIWIWFHLYPRDGFNTCFKNHCQLITICGHFVVGIHLCFWLQTVLVTVDCILDGLNWDVSLWWATTGVST